MESTPLAKSFFKGRADKEISAIEKERDLYACITLQREEQATEEQKVINPN